MHIRIQLLRDPDELRHALRRDGWKFSSGPHDTVVATHPSVPDEVAARDRLHQLGLLTSSCLRIDFCRARKRTS
jgi:hypothetical protein